MSSEKQPDYEIFLSHLLPDSTELLDGEKLSLVFFKGESIAMKRAINWKDGADSIGQLSENGYNCFVGVSTISNECSGRGKESDTISCLSFVLDMDIANPQRGSGKRYFDDESQALQLLRALPIEPTIVTNTGGGIHAWYMFQEPWVFDDASERYEAKNLSRRFWSTANQVANRSGKVLDSTFDLSRIMRIPGTTNHKYGLPSYILESGLHRYDPGDFESWTIPIDDCEPDLTGSVTNFDLKKVGKGIPENWTLIAHADPTLEDLVFHRTQLGSGDESLSAYDLSIASKMKHAGIDDQCIVEIIVWHRRLHNGRPKVPAYYQRTMARVNATVKPGRGIVSPMKQREMNSSAIIESMPDNYGKTQFGRQYGYEVDKIEMFEDDEGGEEFIVHVTGVEGKHTRPVRNLDLLMRPLLWTKIWMIAGDGRQCKITGKTWNQIFLPLIKGKMVKVDPRNPVAERMPRYLMATVMGTLLEPEDLYSYIREGSPFVFEEALYVNHTNLSDYIAKNGRPMSGSAMTRWMEQIGFERNVLRLEMGDGSHRDLQLWKRTDLKKDKTFDGVVAIMEINFDEVPTN